MKTKHVFETILSLFFLYICYRLFTYFILDSKITFDKVKPTIKLSQFVNISEERVMYSQNYYIDNDFIGFNAFIDKKYFITVTKLGELRANYKLIQTNIKPIDNAKVIGISLSDGKEQVGRYIDLSFYPFNEIKVVYYYLDGTIVNINQSKFYEIEMISSSFFNISTRNENKRDFGYMILSKKISISFIEYKNNLFPIDNQPYRSLHDLSGI